MALSWWNLAKAVLAGGIRGTQRVWLCVTLPIPSQSCYHWLIQRPPTLTTPSPSDHFPFCRPAGLGRVHLLPIEATRVQLLNLLLHLQTPNPTTSVSAPVCPFKLISSFMRRDTGLGAVGLITSVALNDGGAVVNEKLVDFSPSCSV